MNRVQHTVVDGALWWQQALTWAVATQAGNSGFVMALANHGIDYPSDPFPNRLFVGAKRVIAVSALHEPDVLTQLAEAQRRQPSFWAGYIGYDIKNQLEHLDSRHPNRLGFPEAYLAEPDWVLDRAGNTITIYGTGDVDALLRAIDTTRPTAARPGSVPAVQCRVTPETYQANVRRIQDAIRAGDVYELNYCVEFFAESALLEPLALYEALGTRSPMPFSAFMKLGDRYLMGASPERFLKKTGRQLRSQPIKGTIRRGLNPVEDARLRQQLLTSEKERAENLMIVDLVRNDLARSAETGTVRVDELFGIYGFRHVFQMISTVSATLRADLSWTDAIRHAFPMGSMTGAPKIRSMQLIDELEVSRRGVYSGALGYVTPDSDFDFSVVIRSLLYDARQQYASFSVGSAITYDADPAHEWAECLLKASAIRAVLRGETA